MRVISFSVLLGLSEVRKAESNDEGQFPGIDVAEEEYDPAFEYRGSKFLDSTATPPKQSDSIMARLLEDAVLIQPGLTPNQARAACDKLGLQLPVPESEYDVNLLGQYSVDHLNSRHFNTGLAKISDDGNGPFYNIYTNKVSAIKSWQNQNGERCGNICYCNRKMLWDYGCDTAYPYQAICVPRAEKGRCMNDQWTYNEDTKQCEPDADLSSIACGSTDMTISIHKAFVYEAYKGDVPSTITIGNKDCKSTWNSDNMAVFKVNFNDECGQKIYHENGTISVSIYFDRSSSKEVDGVRIFTSNEDNMMWTFTCSYDDVISTKDSLEVSVSALTGATTIHTSFPADAFPIKFVNVDNEDDPIKNGDTTRLTIQIPEGFPKILKLHFMNCTATAHDDTSIAIKMVTDGCALDVIDSADASTSENAISYTYTAFSFSEFEGMEIRCESKICLNSEERKECMEMEDTCAEGYTDIF